MYSAKILLPVQLLSSQLGSNCYSEMELYMKDNTPARRLLEYAGPKGLLEAVFSMDTGIRPPPLCVRLNRAFYLILPDCYGKKNGH